MPSFSVVLIPTARAHRYYVLVQRVSDGAVFRHVRGEPLFPGFVLLDDRGAPPLPPIDWQALGLERDHLVEVR